MNQDMSLSQAIKTASNLNTPSPVYFDNFLPTYKRYHKRQNFKRAICKIGSGLAVFIVACLCYSAINNDNRLDIDTASGGEMAQHNTHGKHVVFEGDVIEVTDFIRKQIKEKTQTLHLKQYFEADVWGVYVEGDDKFRYYYQCLGHGRYSVFVIHE
jgi:hypothetical protein